MESWKDEPTKKKYAFVSGDVGDSDSPDIHKLDTGLRLFITLSTLNQFVTGHFRWVTVTGSIQAVAVA